MAIKRRKFRRATPRCAARRSSTRRCAVSSSMAIEGVSVRRISAAAGVSIGLINHHFPSKSGLVAVTYETLALSLQESIRTQAENKAVSPRDRLSGFFRASFAPELLDPQLFNVWLVFWSMVAHSPEIRAVHDKTYGKYRSILESMLGQLADSAEAPPFKLRPAAIALSALLDGLWVELVSESDDIQAARSHCVVRGLGQRAVQRRLSAALDAPKRESSVADALAARCGDHRRRAQWSGVRGVPRRRGA